MAVSSNIDLEIEMARSHDPQRGPFCDVGKGGNRLNEPPAKREPAQDREKNPRGTRHVLKTQQDYQPRDQRERSKQADRQRAWMQEHKPTCSADYARMPK